LPEDQAIPVLEAASAVYRDYGDRTNRRHARLKYVMEERGVEWFRDELAARLGAPLAPPAEVQRYEVHDHLGWHRQADGRWLVGIWIENGRIKDAAKQVLRAIVEHGLLAGDKPLSALRRYAMACPAMPTCGLAVAEAERYLPDLIGELERRGY